jgi:hypothetical protein
MLQSNKFLLCYQTKVSKKLDANKQKVIAEPKVIPSGSTKKRRRCSFKKVLHKLRKDLIPEQKSMKRIICEARKRLKLMWFNVHDDELK